MPLFALFALWGLLAALPSQAQGRRLTHGLQSPALAQGDRELALWVSPRIGRKDHYVRLDNRIEVGLGLTPRLLTGLFFNFTMEQAGVARIDAPGGSLANEWRYRLLDPVAGPVGLSLAAKATLSPVASGLEATVIVDKHLENLLLAFNASAGNAGAQAFLTQTVGVSYLLTPELALGFEVFDEMVFAKDGLRAGIYAGPVVSYTGKRWWLAFTFSPQVASIKPSYAADRPERVDLIENERFTGRLIMGFAI
ncbi:MAG: DUF6662 family protein [Myxococcaceae bacterium]